MFDQEFFPTPLALIQKMIAPYLKDGHLPSMSVLEPSAGKGDIADYVQGKMIGSGWGRRRDTEGIYCIERNPDLQAVLREKDFSVIADDFLAFDGSGYLFDLILMNPPFSTGVAHLLHAWEILDSGNIACILPSEVFRNPYTRERQLLCEIVEDHNGIIEEVGAAFKSAERKTGVEVCIVRLAKKGGEDVADQIFDDTTFDRVNPFDTEEPIINENQMACREPIKRMVTAYTATLSCFAGAVKAMRELQYYGREFGCSYDAHDDRGNYAQREIIDAFFEVLKNGLAGKREKDGFKAEYRKGFNRFAGIVRKAAWKTVFDKTDLARFMTSNVQKEFDNLQKEKQGVEFTEENVMRMLESVLMNGDKICESAIVEAFDLMTKYHEENRVHVEGWKTNDYWKVNRRFILPHIVQNSFGHVSISYRCEKELDDIDRGLCLMEGLRFDQIKTAAQVIRDATRNKVAPGTKIHSYFFEIVYYKKGTGHFLFLDKDVWERFNVAACKGKKWLPASAA